MKAGEVFEASTQLVVIECYKCHILFGMPVEYNEQCLNQRNQKEFWCPGGHPQVYSGENKETILKRQLMDVQDCCTRYRTRVDELEEKIPRMRGGYRSALKRAKEAA